MRSGYVGLVVAIGLWAGLVALGVPHYWRLVVFFPAAMAAIGFLQGLMHFCAGFGMSGVFNFGPNVGRTDTVLQAEFRAKDKRKALSIVLYSALIGVLVAVAAYFL
jgi:hypothetical protein